MIGSKPEYPVAEMSGGSMLGERATIQQRLTRQKAELEKRLKEVNDALESMQDNPSAAELIERIMKVV